VHDDRIADFDGVGGHGQRVFEFEFDEKFRFDRAAQQRLSVRREGVHVDHHVTAGERAERLVEVEEALVDEQQRQHAAADDAPGAAASRCVRYATRSRHKHSGRTRSNIASPAPSNTFAADYVVASPRASARHERCLVRGGRSGWRKLDTIARLPQISPAFAVNTRSGHVFVGFGPDEVDVTGATERFDEAVPLALRVGRGIPDIGASSRG